MTEHEAHQLMAKLIVCTNGWDEAAVRGWTSMLTELGDPEAAARAVDNVCRSWGLASRPPWGKVMESYQSQPRQLALAGSTKASPWMSAHEYLHTLRQRAATGDRGAARDLESWKHHIATSSVWLNAIGADAGLEQS